MPLQPLSLGPEWRLLEILCHPADSEEGSDLVFETLRAEHVNLGTLVELAAEHRLLPMLAHAVVDRPPEAFFPPQLRAELLSLLLSNRRKVSRMRSAAAEVIAALRAAGVDVAVTKGLALEATVYRRLGTRKMNDIDIMVRPSDRGEVTRVMAELGYVHGFYNWREHRIDDPPPRFMAMFRLNPDHLPHFVRLERDGAGSIVVDAANSLTWSASPWQVPLDEALSRLSTFSVPEAEFPLPTLSPVYQFLFTLLHLFRESWFVETAKRKDMLYKYGDLVHLWSAHESELTADLPAIIEKFGLGRPVAWVLTHTDRIFSTDLAAIAEVKRHATEDWLASGRGSGQAEMVWSGTMRERLFARDKGSFFRLA